MEHYTYAHVSNVDKSIFYIGKGQKKRAYVKSNHSKEWKEVAKNGYEVQMLGVWKTDAEAYQHEKFLILCAKDLKWPLVNVAPGGKGFFGNKNWLGKKHSEDSLKKMSKSQTGIKRCKSIKYSIANAKSSNPSWKGYWITPDGKFTTLKEAADHYKVDDKTIRARCKGYKENLVNNVVKHYPPKDGWSFESKE